MIFFVPVRILLQEKIAEFLLHTYVTLCIAMFTKISNVDDEKMIIIKENMRMLVIYLLYISEYFISHEIIEFLHYINAAKTVNMK